MYLLSLYVLVRVCTDLEVCPARFEQRNIDTSSKGYAHASICIPTFGVPCSSGALPRKAFRGPLRLANPGDNSSLQACIRQVRRSNAYVFRFSVIFFSLYFKCNEVSYHGKIYSSTECFLIAGRASDKFVVQKIVHGWIFSNTLRIDRVSCRAGAHPYGGRGRNTWRRYAYRACLIGRETWKGQSPAFEKKGVLSAFRGRPSLVVPDRSTPH